MEEGLGLATDGLILLEDPRKRKGFERHDNNLDVEDVMIDTSDHVSSPRIQIKDASDLSTASPTR